MSSVSTHVLDLVRGGPAVGVQVCLERLQGAAWVQLMEGATNSDGRLPRLALPEEQATGVFRISFATGDWFKARGIAGFYPSVSIVFEITAPSEHYHVPLLLGPYGYSTYRGS